MTKRTRHWLYVGTGVLIAALGEWQKSAHMAWLAMAATLLAQLRVMLGKDDAGNPPA